MKTLIKYLKARNVGGYSYVEIVVGMGIMGILVALTTINLLGSNTQENASTTLDTLLSDMSTQQARAMTGDAGATNTVTAYGVYFQSGKYTLFKGNVYATNAANLTINLPASLTFSTINVPGSQVVYASGSGKFANYISGQNTIGVLNKANNVVKTIYLNTNGVPYQVQ